MKTKILTLGITLMLITTATGMAYSGWRDEVKITGTAKMACWTAKIKIWKKLCGAYTNPYTGAEISTPTNEIAIAASFPTIFKMKIYVKNCRYTTLTNVVVTDTIENNIGPVSWTASQGSVEWYNSAPGGGEWDGVHFGFNELTWKVGSLAPGETAILTIKLKTLMNSSPNWEKYEPTTGDEGDEQDLPVNPGVKVRATSPFNGLSAETDGITLHIVDDGIPENGIGIIATTLPYTTPAASDSYP